MKPIIERAPPNEALLAFGDQRAWILLNDIRYSIGNTGIELVVPSGFVTDLASIPSMFWGPPLFLTPTGQYGRAAIIHDYLYWSQKCSRDQADRLLVVAMKESGVAAIDESAIYLGVHTGGGPAWSKNASDKAAGLPRILPAAYRRPADPNMTWPDYVHLLVSQGVKSLEFPDEGAYCFLGDSTNVPA